MINIVKRLLNKGIQGASDRHIIDEMLAPEELTSLDIDSPERLRLSETVLQNYIKSEQTHEREFNITSRYAEVVTECREKNYKTRIVFHGGCLGCKITRIAGIAECHSCYYYNWVTDNPDFKHDDKSFPDKGKDEYIDEALIDIYPEHFI